MWRDIEGVDGKYQVSECGEIKNAITGRILKQNQMAGYLGVTVKPKCRDGGSIRFRTHREVAKAFVNGEFPGAVVNHIDGNKVNNHATNLEWCTYSHNMQHAIDTKLLVVKLGVHHHMSKLTTDQVVAIRGDTRSLRTIAKSYGISHPQVLALKRGDTYKED